MLKQSQSVWMALALVATGLVGCKSDDSKSGSAITASDSRDVASAPAPAPVVAPAPVAAPTPVAAPAPAPIPTPTSTPVAQPPGGQQPAPGMTYSALPFNELSAGSELLNPVADPADVRIFGFSTDNGVWAVHNSIMPLERSVLYPPSQGFEDDRDNIASFGFTIDGRMLVTRPRNQLVNQPGCETARVLLYVDGQLPAHWLGEQSVDRSAEYLSLKDGEWELRYLGGPVPFSMGAATITLPPGMHTMRLRRDFVGSTCGVASLWSNPVEILVGFMGT